MTAALSQWWALAALVAAAFVLRVWAEVMRRSLHDAESIARLMPAPSTIFVERRHRLAFVALGLAHYAAAALACVSAVLCAARGTAGGDGEEWTEVRS